MKIAIFDTSKAAGAVRFSWPIGALGLKAAGKLDAARGFDHLGTALRWTYEIGTTQEVTRLSDAGLGGIYAEKPKGLITQLELWTHGSPGSISWGGTRYTEIPMADMVRRALAPDAVVWFRSCQTFHGRQGRDFASQTRNALMCSIAGHTFNIGAWQGGLHVCGMTAPDWPPKEGGPKMSTPWTPNVITCLQNEIPEGW